MNTATKRFWTEKEVRTLREVYPDTPTKQVAALLGRSVLGIYQMADKQGLSKSAAYMASPAACRLRRGDDIGKLHRFPKGHVPANKGLRRPGWAPGRMASTHFHKGNRPHTWRPIGTTRLSKEGYLQRKISDTGYPPKDWVGVHILLWTEANGPIPPSHTVCFKDGDHAHIELGNLELVARAGLMRRNSVHNLPPELRKVIQLSGVLRRRIRTVHEKQVGRFTQSSVRDHREIEGRRQTSGH